jgi:hypothetical protein
VSSVNEDNRKNELEIDPVNPELRKFNEMTVDEAELQVIPDHEQADVASEQSQPSIARGIG